jgi:hypothetical protein
LRTFTRNQYNTVAIIIKQEMSDMMLEEVNYLLAVHPELSQTEAHILYHINQKKQNRDIAELYGCSVRNIENHRYRIAKKLGLIPGKKKGERIPHRETPTVGEFGAEARRALMNTRKKIRARSRNTSGTPDTNLHLRQRTSGGSTSGAAHKEVAGSGSQRPCSSGRWLLPGVLFQFEDNDRCSVLTSIRRRSQS